MSSTTENGLYFLGAGALTLLAAGCLQLLQKTRGPPFRSRSRTMLAMAVRGFLSAVPSRLIVCVLLSWLGGFIGGTLICGAICYGLLLGFVSTLPVATEAHEGVGDAAIVLLFAGCGFMISLLVGFFAGLDCASRTYNRLAGKST